MLKETPDSYRLFLKARGWPGHTFAASASPRTSTKKMATSSSSAVHGGQRDTKHVTFA